MQSWTSRPAVLSAEESVQLRRGRLVGVSARAQHRPASGEARLADAQLDDAQLGRCTADSRDVGRGGVVLAHDCCRCAAPARRVD
eukprot:4504807-Prymnesium_polylepis.1